MLWLLRHAEAADGYPDDDRGLGTLVVRGHGVAHATLSRAVAMAWTS